MHSPPLQVVFKGKKKNTASKGGGNHQRRVVFSFLTPILIPRLNGLSGSCVAQSGNEISRSLPEAAEGWESEVQGGRVRPTVRTMALQTPLPPHLRRGLTTFSGSLFINNKTGDCGLTQIYPPGMKKCWDGLP